MYNLHEPDGPLSRRPRRGETRHPEHDRGGPGGTGVPGGPRRGRGGARRHGRARASRGDVRAAVLLLLAEEPMHGYQLMHAIADRTGGRWTPSPGAVYPTINQMEDEGLVEVTAGSGRKLVTLTRRGEEYLAEHRTAWPDPFGHPDDAGSSSVDFRRLVGQLADAVKQVARTGTDEQRAAAAEALVQARRSMYLILADEVSGPPQPRPDAIGSGEAGES